ncbi:MATE family efflux transporter [Nocardiopsis metallicus]|uniref:Probable multidrug resistance protein NorM n=1 Tax=Nocardiopsis metallicus TaxID=179819 RepID=A0A840WJR0_9ACTN|nr:MATE family efflux transporter [Nocardiopsis metallicus]MBB5491917.1 MATE family multidrug resistance protein [Nocardiopsis metallicus]
MSAAPEPAQTSQTPQIPQGTAEPPELPKEPGLIARRIAGKALPLYLSMLSTLIGSAVTAAVLGNTSTVELAAYALVLAVFNPMIMVVHGTLRGSTPFFAENEDSPRALAPVVRDSLWLSLLLGGVGGLLILAVPPGARLIGVAEPTVAALGLYPLLMAGYVVLASVKNSTTVLMVALGHTKAVLALSLTAVALSLVLTPLLVLGPGPFPELGLLGAGLAMLSMNVLTLGLNFAVVGRVTVLRGHRIGFGAPRWPGIGRMAKVGLPSGSTLLIKSGSLSVVAVVVARIGPQEAAVHQLVAVLLGMSFISCVAVGQATVPFTVRAARARSGTLVVRTVLASYLVSVPVVLTSGALMWWAAGPLVWLFTDDPRVHAGVVALVPLLCLVGLFDALQSAPNSGMLGLKDTRPAVYAFAFGYGLLALVSVPAVELGGLTGLWSASAAAVASLVVLQWVSFGRMCRGVGSSVTGDPSTR